MVAHFVEQGHSEFEFRFCIISKLNSISSNGHDEMSIKNGSTMKC